MLDRVVVEQSYIGVQPFRNICGIALSGYTDMDLSLFIMMKVSKKCTYHILCVDEDENFEKLMSTYQINIVENNKINDIKCI